MNAVAEHIWHAVQDACVRGKAFLHEDGSGPHEDAFAKHYRIMMRNMMCDSAELEAECNEDGGSALDNLIADLIADRR